MTLGYTLKYSLDGSNTNLPPHAEFNGGFHFYLDNEISTYLKVPAANFSSHTNYSNILFYYSDGVEFNAKPRRRNATYIEHYTIDELRNNYTTLKTQGYLLPESGFDVTAENLPKDGIGAFKVTSVDGKTYHYSLPVYNHEIITRTYGTVSARPNENQSYFEKRQLEPYATHWLLTAVTGPDYFDTNDNGVADKGDYGYWTTFEYGQWSDAFTWKTPYGKDYHESETNSNVKTWIRGRKQMYYLDRVKTRTHTAIFVKSERLDARSTAWDYSSVAHIDNLDQTSSNYQTRFSIPAQSPLRLDKVILVKAANDNLNKTYGSSSESYVDILYNDATKPSEKAWYNLKDRVIDVGDNWSELIDKAIKVIDFTYDYTLAKGSPNTASSSHGKLTLNSVNFKGKRAKQLIPPYHFNYLNNPTYTFDIEDKDGFGYYNEDNSIWSLNEIITPQGGKIQVNYEHHDIKPVVKSKITFKKGASSYNIIKLSSTTYEIRSDHDFGIQVGNIMNFTYTKDCYMQDPGNCGGPCGEDLIGSCETIQDAVVISDNGDNSYTIQISNVPSCDVNIDQFDYCTRTEESFEASYDVDEAIQDYGGIRVSDIVIADDINSYTTSYKYGENENGIGYVSYLPFAPELEEELPYSAELPAPKVMYEYVAMEANQTEGKTQYKFKVFKEKEEGAIKFGDLYEVEVFHNEHYNSVADKDVVINKYTVKDNLASLGQLLEVSTLNKEGHVLGKIENTYYSPNDPTPNNIGVTQEAYQTYKVIDFDLNTANRKDRWFVNSSARIKYPSLLKYSTEYKSGYQYRSLFGEIDQITGQSLEVLSVASDGTQIKSRTIPAYHKYPQMGSKVDNVSNRNMLSQDAMSIAYVLIDDQWKETGVGITTWNNEWVYTNRAGIGNAPTNDKEKVWRKHKNYKWEGSLNFDGTLQGYSDTFDWNVNAVQTNEWKLLSEITKYNHFSTSIEVKDVNNNRETTKMSDDGSKVHIVGNAGFGELFYTGGEYESLTGYASYADQQILMTGGASRTGVKFHSGKYGIQIPQGGQLGAIFRANQFRTGKYKLSVWVHKDNYLNVRVNSGTSFNGEIIPAGNWVQMNHYFTLDNNTLEYFPYITSANGTIYIDDYRIHPISSSATTYVYNEWDQLSYVFGTNNLGTHYQYDDAGRLIGTYKEVVDNSAVAGGFKKVSAQNYHYKNN